MPTDTVWQSDTLTNTYLSGVRGAIPLAAQQIDVMLRLVAAARGEKGVTAVLDIGCGDGILGQAILDQHPTAHATFLDFSAPMLEAARMRLAAYDDRATFVQADYGEKGWHWKLAKEQGSRGAEAKTPLTSAPPHLHTSATETAQFDVVVSGYSIHHQPDTRKREIYAEIYDLLTPGGIFINVEHVASASKWVEHQFDELFVDALHRYSQDQNLGKSRDEMAQEFYYRPDKVANILAPVEDQCQWLRAIGFNHVDIYLKIFELAVFGGVKPSN